MKQLIGILLFGLVFAVASASAQRDYCFENQGLKDQHRVSITITGNKVEGTFEVSGYDPATSAETFDFTGTKSGTLLRIRFEGKPPYQLPPKTKQIVWTQDKTRLRIPTREELPNKKILGLCDELHKMQEG
jgi:hypothetical protein